MDPREHLRALVDASPGTAVLTVPRDWLVALLGDAEPSVGPVDLTVTDLAARYGRAPATVRWWLEQGRIPGAYRLRGREWRVSLASLAAFEASERARTPAPKAAPTPDTTTDAQPAPSEAPPKRTRGRVVDLGDWRKVG